MSLAERLAGPDLRRRLLWALGGVVVAGLLALGGWAWHRHQESRGLAALGETSVLVREAQGPGATVEGRQQAITALEAVIARYPRLSAIPQAAYDLGNLRYARRDWAAARGAYEMALAKGAAGALRPLAALGVGYSWEAEKDHARALEAYEAVLRGLGPTDFLYEEAAMAVARAQELLGKPQAAAEVYRQLLKELPDSPRADQLRSRLAALQASPR